ncbi:membrane protein insertase YidC [bacterium]|nr:membrane protein insertase YidC [bacterium]
MDHQRRLLLFGLSCFLILVGWGVVGPFLFPGMFPEPKPKDQLAQKAGNERAANDKVGEADNSGTDTDLPAVSSAEGDAPANEPPSAASGESPAKAAGVTEPAELEKFKTQVVTLGSQDPKSGYSLWVDLTSVGASVVKASLNDARYIVETAPPAGQPRAQLSVVGNNVSDAADVRAFDPDRRKLTLDLDLEAVDEALKSLDPKASLRSVNWEVVATTPDPEEPGITSSVTFACKAGGIEVRKTFTLHRLSQEESTQEDAVDLRSTPYELAATIEIRNLADEEKTLQYALQGPVGLALENAEHARKFRDLKAGFFAEGGGLTTASLTAAKLVKAADNDTIEEWTRPVRYIGIDVQYFAALVIPGGDQVQSAYFSRVVPEVVDEAEKKERSDISFEMVSTELTLPPKGNVTHDLTLYLGPKRTELLLPYGAEGIIDHGWFAAIANVMEYLVKTFHGWGAPYGIAIIMLTVIVRGCMFPISKKQALSAKRMKELQPQLTELREKYKDDRQALAQAQMELYRKANFNPLAGCLPVFLQLPIFIGLYRALSNSVDLRMAPFLWFDNLAAPDNLFTMSFSLPFIGNSFNLLPLITMGLFWFQQKMFMPPAQNPEMEMQQKMMSYMMIFFGFLFYHVPAGLCVYFIASSGWGMTERKLLEYLPEKKQPENVKPRKEGWLARKLKELQEVAEMQQQLQQRQKDRQPHPHEQSPHPITAERDETKKKRPGRGGGRRR